MSDNTAPARKHCSLQEALEAVGKSAFPSEWTGHEANLSPAKDFATLRRHVRSTRALLALLHDGRVTAWFIFDGSTLEEQRREIIPSAWPNPVNFLAQMPFGDLWFDLVSSRGVLRPKPEDSPAWYQRFANTPLWHAYSPLTGRIELDQVALRLAIGDGTGQASVVQEPEEADDPPPSPPRKKAPKPRGGGRKKGSGSFADKDKPLLEVMKPLIANGTSHWAAAMTVVSKAAGAGNDQSKAKRLVARYREWEKSNSV